MKWKTILLDAAAGKIKIFRKVITMHTIDNAFTRSPHPIRMAMLLI